MANLCFYDDENVNKMYKRGRGMCFYLLRNFEFVFNWRKIIYWQCLFILPDIFVMYVNPNNVLKAS